MNLNDINEIFEIVKNSNKICIAGHKAPDGDCIGSVMALYELLNSMNKNLTVCIDGLIPFNLIPFIEEDIISHEYVESKYDVLFMLDCSDANRLGIFSDLIKNSSKTICIDHHKTNESFADINIIDTEISSTGELLYKILIAADKNITKKIAEFLYIAIVTDTGKFSYSNTSSETHRIASDLIDLGINVSYVDNVLYNSKPSNIVKAFIECIGGVQLYYDNKFGIASITQKILEDNNADMGDIDGVVEFIREIKEVEVSCVLKEYDDNNTKVSLRSKNEIDVSEISKKYGGGGHAKAAGFEVLDTLENTKKLLIKEYKKYFGE